MRISFNRIETSSINLPTDYGPSRPIMGERDLASRAVPVPRLLAVLDVLLDPVQPFANKPASPVSQYIYITYII